MKKINIALVGGLGRMGKILAKKILNNKKLKLHSVTDLRSGRSFKKNIKIQKNNLNAFKKADVIIDFSRPKSSLEALYYAKKLRKKIVIGTTGFSEKQTKLIKNYS
jgi:4-hydroxy-tetrahydrodipicolinate reductase